MHDTEHRDAIVCPDCGAEDPDSWELFDEPEDGDGSVAETSCHVCGAPITVTLHLAVTYTTRLNDDEEEE